jgi:hypothetical protein
VRGVAKVVMFGQLSADKYLASEAAAKDGVTFTNHSLWKPLVTLKHFGPNHPDMPESASD